MLAYAGFVALYLPVLLLRWWLVRREGYDFGLHGYRSLDEVSSKRKPTGDLYRRPSSPALLPRGARVAHDITNASIQ